MQVPLEITFRDVQKTDEMDDLIREKSAKLDRICDHLSSCRVVVEKPQKNQSSGQPYRVRIDLTIPPGHEIVVNRDPNKGNLHLDLAAEIRWAFDAAGRQLKELMEKQRRDVKTHPDQEVQGVVMQLMPENDEGFIRALDGRDIYFHRNSVLHGDYDRMKIGTGVRYAEEMGEKGPQASTVQIIETSGSY